MTFVIWFFVLFVFIAGVVTLIDGIKNKNKKDIINGSLLFISPIIFFICFVII